MKNVISLLSLHDLLFSRECRKPKFVAPRLFCDICDMFDLHETEDCPRQSNSSPPPVQRDTPKIKPPPRPYCENCESEYDNEKNHGKIALLRF